MAAIDAVFPAAGQPNLFEELADEGLTAHKVRKVYVINFGSEGDTFVNISDVIDLKIAALKAHTSQMGEWDPEPMLREWSAKAAQGKEMAHAESFRVITLVSDEDFAKRQDAAQQAAAQQAAAQQAAAQQAAAQQAAAQQAAAQQAAAE